MEGFWEIKENSFKEYPSVITGEKYKPTYAKVLM